MRETQEFLSNHRQVFVQQTKEWVQIITDIETQNKYTILDSQKNPLGFIAERGGGFWRSVQRLFLRTHRPFEIDVFGVDGQVSLILRRDFFWFWSDLEVLHADRSKAGSIHRRFALFSKCYDLVDEYGTTFGRVQSGLFRIWKFPILDSSGNERALITKQWGGVLKEVFTDADTYLIDFSTHPWTDNQRRVILATAISIDFDFFEDNQGERGILNSARNLLDE